MDRINKKIIIITLAAVLLSIFVCGVYADEQDSAAVIKSASTELITFSGDVSKIQSDLSNVITLNGEINPNSPTVSSEIIYISTTLDVIANNTRSVSEKMEPVRNSVSEIALGSKYPPEGLFEASAALNNLAGQLGNVPSDLASVSAELTAIAAKAENVSEYPTPTPLETPTAAPTLVQYDDEGNEIYVQQTPDESELTSSYNGETPEIDYSAYYTPENLTTDLARVSSELQTIANSLNGISSGLVISSNDLAVVANRMDSSIPVDNTQTALPTETPTSAPIVTETSTEIPDTFTPTQTETPNEDNNTIPSGEEDNTFGTVLIIIIIVAAAAVIAVVVVIVIRKKKSKDNKKFDELTSSFMKKQDSPEPIKTELQKKFEEPVEEEYTEPVVEPERTAETKIVEEVKPVEFSLSDSNIPLIEVYRIIAKCIAKKYGIKNIESFTPKQVTALVKEPTAELKEFTNLYEKMKYSQESEPEDKERLVSLAETILKQYRS